MIVRMMGFYVKILLFIEWVVLSFMSPEVWSGKILSMSVFLLTLFMLVKAMFRRNYYLAVLFFFMLDYSFQPIRYYWYGEHINVRTVCETSHTVYLTALILFLFLICLYSILKWVNVSKRTLFAERKLSCFFLCIVLAFLCITFGVTGSTIFASGGYSNSLQEGGRSSLFAYGIIPLTLSLLYADTKRKRQVVYLIVAYFVIKNLLYGGRVESLQLLLCMFLVRFQYVWSAKRVLLIGLLGYVFLTAWGTFRGDTTMSLTSDTFELDFGGNASDVYYASMRVLYLIDIGALDVYSRALSLLYFLASIVVPSSWLPRLANLSLYMTDTYSSGGGGLAPIFFFVFGGYLGVIALAWFIGKSLNAIIKRKTSYVFVYTVFLVATAPRWFAYYPIQIVKFCVVGLLFYYIMEHMPKRLIR